jgi:hypothetical protein
VADLNGDGVQEVILNATDPYVFCYACGVRKIGFQVFTWDSPDERMMEVSLQPFLMGQPQPMRDLVNPTVKLAQAGLWKDALDQISEAKELATQYPESDAWTLDWDYTLIKLHADAMAEEVAESQYPLLSNIFYGDYAAALDIMRGYDSEELFGPDSRLIVGTVAEGWEDTLSEWIIDSTSLALEAQPDLAAAYFLRGWAIYLVNPNDPEALADLERAAELAPDEPLFTQIDVKDLQDKSLTEFELDLLASGYTAETRKLSQDGATYRASIYTHMEWYTNPNYLLIAKTQGEQTTIIYELQEEGRMMFVAYTPQESVDLDWVDMNADGLMELPYQVGQGGNCWTCTQMQVLQLRPDDSVVNLTKSVPAEDKFGEFFALSAVMDVDNDGVQERLVVDARFELAFNLCHACSPGGFRVYAWDGETYRNASAQFPDYYQEQIDDLTTQIEAMMQSGEPWSGYEVGPMVSLLLAYENAGRSEEGLAVFERYSDPTLYTERATEEQLQSLQEARRFFLPQGTN